MKKLIFLVIISLFSNILLAQKIYYHFLDSNHVEVFLKNPDKISYKERKKIYYYVEYKVNRDNYVDNFKIYYADGCKPSVNENEQIVKNKKPYLTFSNPDLRTGSLASQYEIMWKKKPLSFNCNNFENNDTTCFTKISKTGYYPNGQPTHQKFEYYSYYSKRENKDSYYQKIKSNNIIFYTSNGAIDYSADYKKGDLYQAVQELPSGIERIWYYESGIVTKVKDFKNGKKTAIYYYENGEYDKSRTEKFSLNGVKLFNGIWTEKNVKEYLDSRDDLEPLEGLYTVNSKTDGQLTYTIAVLQDENGKLNGHQISWYSYNAKAWKAGEIRATFEEIAVKNFYKVMWKSDYKNQEVNDVVQDETGGALLTFGNYNMVKLYPKYSSSKSTSKNNTEWNGNGSGFFISKSGYIATNYHVIDGVSEIEVEFRYKNEIKGFNAKVIKVDKTNDLAILKIDDDDFSYVGALPYTFRTRSVDVGTQVFALGYPMALSLMGKDIKFTDGKISSKTGLDGDITKYQIQVPIQPGNSGGPLFDTKGNLIGITSSGINRKLDLTENVNYAIKTNYLLNLIEVLPETITLPSSTQLASKQLTEQIKALSDYVVLIKVK